jgi:Chaperone of endosialidase
MRISPSGNVGIGTTSPVGLLSVNTANATVVSSSPGNITSWDNTFSVFGNAGSTSGGGVGLAWNSTYGGILNSIQPSLNWNDMNYNANAHKFWSRGGASASMTLDSSGKLGIGTSPSYQLQLSSDSAAKPTTNTWTISSDKRVKKDIVDADIDICYNNIVNIPLRRYAYNTSIEEYSADNIKDINVVGFIADEFKEYFPKGVIETTNRLTVPNDFEFEDMTNIQTEPVYITVFSTGGTGGIVLTESTGSSTGATSSLIEEKIIDPTRKILVVPDFKGLNSSQIIPTLVGAVKKQNQLISSQQTLITQLQNELALIKAHLGL